MEENSFKINRFENKIIIEKDNKKFTITQSIDNDFYIYTSEDELVLELKAASFNYNEIKTHLIFESLIKSIIGRYFLSGDYKKEYKDLPEDFICLDTNTIIWHSDSIVDNTLKIEYNNPNIKISISKCKNSKKYDKNSIRIRTNGSSYGFYYQEFIPFFNNLCQLAIPLDNTLEDESIKIKRKSILKNNQK